MSSVGALNRIPAGSMLASCYAKVATHAFIILHPGYKLKDIVSLRFASGRINVGRLLHEGSFACIILHPGYKL
jgi:hypothetical protein